MLAYRAVADRFPGRATTASMSLPFISWSFFSVRRSDAAVTATTVSIQIF
jgi:hypothetical protein